MKKFKYLLSIAILCGLSISLFSQKLTTEDIILYKDIVFTTVEGHELKLDIAVPKYLKSPSPAIVDIPGGAWRKAEKNAQDALFYAKHGFIGISITHRTSDIALFPAAVHDCKTAVRWVRANASKYNIDPSRIGITGASSGGHLATLLGTSKGDKYLEGDGDYLDYSSDVQAVVNHFGPTDFLQKADNNEGYFSDPNSPQALFLGGPVNEKKELARLANPITYIDKNDPPIIIMHGENDGLVNISQSEILFDALNKANVPTRLIRVKNADHMYHAYEWDQAIKPSIDQLFLHTIDWFEQWLGKPQIDYNSIPSKTLTENSKPKKAYDLFYRLTIDLAEKSNQSYCKGRYSVMCEGEILASGNINFQDLSTEEKSSFQTDLTFSAGDLTNKLIVWNFRGEVFDASLNELFEPGQLQNTTFDDTIIGLGFDLIIGKDKSIKFNKKVYRK